MREKRVSASQTVEMWNAKDISNHLNCDKMKAEEIVKAVCALHNAAGYGDVQKEWVLDFLQEKERVQREREARYQADISTAESVAVLKEQVKTLKEQVKLARDAAISSKASASRANTLAIVAIVVSAFATIAAAFIH